MADVVFVVNPSGYNKAFKTWTGDPVGRYMIKKTEQVRGHARTLAPGPHKPPHNTTGIVYGTGELARRITVTRHHAPSGDLEGHVVSLPKHSLWVQRGTRGPYVIRPKKPGGLLKFHWHKVGRTVYLRKVTHPGIQIAQPFLADALDASF
jgi:hypothetical protein